MKMSVAEKSVRLDDMPSLFSNSPSTLKSKFSAKSPVKLMLARRTGFRGALLFQTTDFSFQLGVSFLQLLHCPLQLLQSVRLRVAAGVLRPQRLNYQKQQRKGNADPT